MDTLQRNQQAFGNQAKGFSSQGDTYADEEGLAWMLAELPMSANLTALDVATGTGEFARALAAHVANVIGIDATEAMLETGKRFVRENGIENVEFRKGIVQDLPFGDGSFDIVASRYAFHHFEAPAPVVAEMARVCKPGGYVILVDIVSPVASMAETYNHYERLCDPSHTRCLDFEEIESLFRSSDLDVVSARRRDIEGAVVEWMDFSLTEDKNRKEILRALNEELNGGAKTGLAPYVRDSVLYFRQRDAAVVGQKA